MGQSATAFRDHRSACLQSPNASTVAEELRHQPARAAHPAGAVTCVVSSGVGRATSLSSAGWSADGTCSSVASVWVR